MAMKIQIVVFCIVNAISDVVGYCFRGPCCLHLHGKIKVESTIL